MSYERNATNYANVANPITLTLVDKNPRVIAAFASAFASEDHVVIARGSLLRQDADAWVTPTNALGSMDGGLDAAIKRHLGAGIQHKVHREIARAFGGFLPIGSATCVATGARAPRYLISTPTMFGSSEDVGGTHNAAVAAAAAFQAVRKQNLAEPGSIRSVALPGLGAGTGRVAPEACAAFILAAYHLFRAQERADAEPGEATVPPEVLHGCGRQTAAGGWRSWLGWA